MSSLMPKSKSDKIDLLELEDEKERRRQEDPLKYAKSHQKQIDATVAMHPIRTLFWGNRVGKTEWGAQEVSRYATNDHPYRYIGEPVEIWAACPSFDAQEETTQKKLLNYLPTKQIARVDYLRGKIIKKITMRNGSIITFKSYDQGREKFQGAGKRLIWFDEEPPHDIYEECFVRVDAGVQLDVIMTMTPIKGMTWVYDEIYLATDNPDPYVSEAGWDDNPWLTEKQKEQMSRGLSAQAIQVRRFGKFIKRVGLVCAWWERGKHLRHYDTLDRSWTWYEVLDGGYSDPAAWLLIGVDHDNNVHVVDGFRDAQLDADQIKERRDVKVSGLMIRRGFTDNDNPRLVLDLAKSTDGRPGMQLKAVEKKAHEGQSWDETLARKLDEYGEIQKGTGKPRLFISDSLVRLSEHTGKDENWMVQEIENLVWLNRASKQGEEVIPQWDDHRRFGHHFDCMRALSYFLISYMQPVERRVRREKHYDEVTGRLLS